MTRARALRAWLVGFASVGATVVVPAAPAGADAARPTDYRSSIVEVSPALPAGVTVRVVGGDSFLELSVPPGHRAEVADYATSDDAEPVPYLRFDADGTVQRNELAVATTANESRYGASSGTPDPSAEPRWETVATTGTYAWHDHRIHWMSPSKPTVDDGGRVDLGGPDGTWTVPITVDGTPTVVTGTLVAVAPPSPAAWAALGALVLGCTLGLSRRWGLRAGAALTVGVAGAAVLVARATWLAIPPAAGGSVIPVIVAGVGLVAALVAVIAPARWRLVACAGAAAALVGWAAMRATVLTRGVLPTTLPYGVDRAVTAAALGAGLALAAALLWPARRTAAEREPGPPVTAIPSA